MPHATALDTDLVRRYGEQGYAVVPALFSGTETDLLRAHFDAMHRGFVATGTLRAGDRITDPDDPLAAYPRIMHPHRRDAVSRDWLLDARLRSWLNALTGRDPFAVQTMFYFKPPGARGQALHQDQRTVRVRPGTCIAAWMAVDRCDTENGCLQVVPGTHELPVLCTETADLELSFTDFTVPVPADMTPEDVIMEPGDVLFLQRPDDPRQPAEPQPHPLPAHADRPLHRRRGAPGIAPLLSRARHGRPRGCPGGKCPGRPLRHMGGPQRPPARGGALPAGLKQRDRAPMRFAPE